MEMNMKKNYLQSIRTRRGSAGEDAAFYQLGACGFAAIVRIFTGWKIIRWIDIKRRIARVAPVKKVEGDFRAVAPGSGKSVLVEVKTRGPKLSLSFFETHQREALSLHYGMGGISLVAWVNDQVGEVFILEWPIPGFKKGKPISTERAKELDSREKWRKLNGSRCPPLMMR
jgi:hypothetical protein